MDMEERTAADALDDGRAALDAGEWERARDLFEVALEREQTAAALEGLGWAAWWLADEQLTFSARERAYRLHRTAADDAGAGRVATWLAADFREFRGEDAVGRGWLERAHRLLDALAESPDHGWLDLIDADFLLNVDRDVDGVVELARRAADRGRRFGVADLEAVGLALEGLALVGRGAMEPGMARLDEASAMAAGEEMRLPIASGWALCCALSACDGVGDFARASQWCDAVRRFSERWGGRQLLGVCRTSYGRVLAIGGDWPAAEAELLAAIGDIEAARPGMASYGALRLGELRARQGRTDDARELFRSAGLHGLAALGELALAEGDATGAAEAAERVLRRLPPTSVLDRLPALELLARARIALGDAGAAEAAGAEVERAAGSFGTPYVRGRSRLLAAETAAGRGDHERARRAAEDAIDCFGELSAPYEAAQARVELARALHALGRGARAREEAGGARETFERLGARRDAGCAAALAEAVPSAADAQGAELGGLTAREVEVLRLVARGLSDAEIAAQLVVSPHTVHRHVANVRAKLRLPSRSAAVAYAARQGLL